MRLILAASAAMLILPSAAFAQAGPGDTATADATAEVVAPIQIACTSMHFAQIAPIQTATTVGLPAQGGPLVDPDNVVVPGSRSTATPTGCSVHGEQNFEYTVTLPTSIELSNTGGQQMLLDTFTISSDAAAPFTDRFLNDTDQGLGFDVFGVGATLHVGGNQAPGVYSGQFNVSVQYN